MVRMTGMSSKAWMPREDDGQDGRYVCEGMDAESRRILRKNFFRVRIFI